MIISLAIVAGLLVGLAIFRIKGVHVPLLVGSTMKSSTGNIEIISKIPGIKITSFNESLFFAYTDRYGFFKNNNVYIPDDIRYITVTKLIIYLTDKTYKSSIMYSDTNNTVFSSAEFTYDQGLLIIHIGFDQNYLDNYLRFHNKQSVSLLNRDISSRILDVLIDLTTKNNFPDAKREKEALSTDTAYGRDGIIQFSIEK